MPQFRYPEKHDIVELLTFDYRRLTTDIWLLLSDSRATRKRGLPPLSLGKSGEWQLGESESRISGANERRVAWVQNRAPART